MQANTTSSSSTNFKHLMINMSGTSKTWLGSSLDDIYHHNGPWGFDIEPITPSKRHAVLYQLPINLVNPPRPHVNAQPSHGEDHVLMPFNDRSLHLVEDEDQRESYQSHWPFVQFALLKPIQSSRQFQEIVSSYNSRCSNFAALHNLFEEVLEEQEAAQFFDSLLPGIVALALRLPEVLPGNVPLLKQGTVRSVSLSQQQIACLLANAFLCTFSNERPKTYPGINFGRLFGSFMRQNREQCVIEKLKCICHYFRTVLRKEPVGVVTFERKYLTKQQVPRWDRVANTLCKTKIHVCSSGLIENNGDGLLQVDFANKLVGGGVLGYGGVQEEIRYAICPELIISRLFTEELGPTEALVITGAERYSKYTGYGDTFEWTGNYEDHTPYDSSGRRRTSIVAIDATKFNRPSDQFHASAILREVTKAYAGFHSNFDEKGDKRLPAVATGNWGCGAFKGDPHLKFLIQLIACNVAHRDMVYFTFGNIDLRDQIYQVYLFLATNQIKVSYLWKYLSLLGQVKIKSEQIFAFIQQAHFDNCNHPEHALDRKNFFSSFKDKKHQQQWHRKLSQKDSLVVVSSNSSTPRKNQSETNVLELDEFDISMSDFFDKEEFGDIIDSSQLEKPLFDCLHQRRKDEATSSLPVSRDSENLPKRTQFADRQKEMFGFIDKIDGISHVETSDVKSASLLNLIDDLNKSKTTTEGNRKGYNSGIESQENESMEVDEVVESETTVGEQSQSGSLVGGDKKSKRKKITDYFTKVDKG